MRQRCEVFLAMDIRIIEEFWCQDRIVPLRGALKILLNVLLSEKGVLLTISNSFMIS
jgi:hypothetical protein